MDYWGISCTNFAWHYHYQLGPAVRPIITIYSWCGENRSQFSIVGNFSTSWIRIQNSPPKKQVIRVKVLKPNCSGRDLNYHTKIITQKKKKERNMSAYQLRFSNVLNKCHCNSYFKCIFKISHGFGLSNF